MIYILGVEERKAAISELLQQAAEDRGWSYRDLARRAGIKPGTAWKHVRGISLPNPEMLRAYARAISRSERVMMEIAGYVTPAAYEKPADLQALQEILDRKWPHMTPELRRAFFNLLDGVGDAEL